MAEEEDTKYGLTRVQLSPREQRQLDREERRTFNKSMYGTNIPNVEQKRAYEAMRQGAAVADEIRQRGGSIPLDGLNEVGQPISTLGMTDSEKFFAVGRMKDAQRRAEKEQAPLKQFERDVNTSVAFGSESALLTPEGRTRAMKQAVKAGMSYQDADAAVQGAFDFLNKRYGKKDTTPPEQYGPPKALANPAATGAASTGASAKDEIVVPETKTERSPLAKFWSGEEDQAGGSAARGVVKGGRAGDVLYDALKGKVGEAKNIVSEFNKSGGKLVDQGSLMGAADEAAKGAADAAAKLQAFEDKYAGNAPKAGSPAEAKAVRQYNDLKDAADAANAAKEATSKAASEAAETAAKAASAEKVAGGIGGKIVAAGEAVGGAIGKYAKPLKPLAPVARIAGKIAGPAIEAYDAYKYFAGGEDAEENQKIRDQYLESTATMGSRLFGADSSAMERLGALGDVLSPTKNVLGLTEGLRQWSNAAQSARESEAGLKTMQDQATAAEAERRQMYSDEQFKALDPKDRAKIMFDIRRRIRTK